MNEQLKKLLFIAISIFCLSPFCEAPIALLLGIVFSFAIGNPFLKYNGKLTKILLQGSVVGLGFGMNAIEALEVGKEGLIFTIISISFTLLLGLLLGRLFKVEKNTSTLISSGTAICGGSAIAAMAPVVKADNDQITIALASVFILNSVALFIFPPLGHWLDMSQHQFGMWSAIAIHDTSSVVGAAHKFGDEALKIATMVKLERTLWIIPMAFIFASFNKGGGKKIAIPYFIFYFVLAMLANTFLPQHLPILSSINEWIVVISKSCLKLTLFLIGSGLTLATLKRVGVRPMLQGVILWAFISVFSLLVILKTMS